MTGGRRRPRRTERFVTSHARRLHQQLVAGDRERRRHAAAIAVLDAEATVTRAELAAIRDAQAARLGVDVPLDPFVLDALEQIDLEPDGVWRWRGMRNNHGTPTVRYPRTDGSPNGREGSAVRMLAVAFGVLEPDAPSATMLFPAPGYDPDDVNPWHRVRRTARVP